jgi:antitoxin component YwqK of YwqJK toxin-antitoxin module
MAKIKFSFISVLIFTILLFLWVDTSAQQPLNGIYKEFHPNGKVKVKGKYTNGNKTGNWYYYTDKKILEKREYFKKGKLKRTYTYNEKGQLAVIEDDKGNVITKPACGCQ